MNLVRLVLLLNHFVKVFADKYADQYYNNDGKIGTNDTQKRIIDFWALHYSLQMCL